MNNTADKKPLVLVLAGHDPSGSAGIQADIESITSNGCHAATVITALTIQNTSRFVRAIPVDPVDFQQQIDLLLQEMQFNACKIGLVSSVEILTVMEKVLARLNNIPVIVDPVISAGSGEKISTDIVCNTLYEKILPVATMITPNSEEARKLTGLENLDAAADVMLELGCKSVLITGSHEPTDKIINTLYTNNEDPVIFKWERLAGVFHGSGCTLSAAITARMALGYNIKQAATVAQEYTWQTLKHAVLHGKKQYHPDRFYKS